MNFNTIAAIISICFFAGGPVACFLVWSFLDRDGSTAFSFACLFMIIGFFGIMAVGEAEAAKQKKEEEDPYGYEDG